MPDPSDDDSDGGAGGATPPREPPSVDEADRLVANAEVHKSAWEETLEDLWALEEEFEAEGWETITTAAGHTGPVAPVHGKDYWGISHIVPDTEAGLIEEAVEAGEFPKYDVYRNTVRGRVFAVVVYLDPGTETAILLATNFELRKATELVMHAREVGHVNSVFRYLDGTVVAEVRHDEPEKFFPKYDEFETYEAGWASEPNAGEDE